MDNVVSVALDGAKLNLQKMYKSYHQFVTGPLRDEWSMIEAEIEADVEPPLLQIITDTALSEKIKDKKKDYQIKRGRSRSHESFQNWRMIQFSMLLVM